MKKWFYRSSMWLSLLMACPLYAQNTFPESGLELQADIPHAIYADEVWVNPETKLAPATILVQDGYVVWVKAGKHEPRNAVFHDYSGLNIYPSFIDLYSSYGIQTDKLPKRKPGPHYDSKKKGPYYWNDAIRPETRAYEHFKPDEKAAGKYLNAGFGLAVSHNPDGIVRGSGVLVAIGSGDPHELVLTSEATGHYSFSKGSSAMNYPSSLMGSIALMRQYFSDLAWYADEKNRDHQNLSLAAGNELRKLPAIMDAGDALSVLRANELFRPRTNAFILKTDNDAYQVATELRNTGTRLIVPVTIPKPLQLDNPFDFDYLSLEEMKHWEWAPQSLAILKKNGLNAAITLDGCKNAKEFWKNLRKMIGENFSEKDALAALTTIPAQFLGAEGWTGQVKAGYIANFLVSSGNLFDDGRIIHNWVKGQPHVVSPVPQPDFSGVYRFSSASFTTDSVKIGYKDGKNSGKMILSDSLSTKVGFEHQEGIITLQLFAGTDSVSPVTLTPGDRRIWRGQWISDGRLEPATLSFLSNMPAKKDKKKNDANGNTTPMHYTYPLKAYGYDAIPKAESILFKNATVWTNTAKGILRATDVWINNGKIIQIGQGLNIPGAKVIDARGRHLTTGIVDEHSHIAISKGVNEGGQSVSAEVTIEDVVNPWDVNIYRQLAGGVTAAQLLHGSANPIGGRSALVKLKYGSSPGDMLIDGADGFIKFALGENVKQSNWGDLYTQRFPQTRMGVEQLMKDAFSRAIEYRKKREAFKQLPPWKQVTTAEPPRDLEAEVLLEILDGKRFVTCHSYVQSEINMLIKLAESFGFRINTFTHILEGYKVADKMREHGAAGSTFSDWWAYKFEVKDAIPWNAALMHGNGILTAINSDDAEMGRRLNQEAAKVVKYGGVSEEEAWKMVTLNPARILHLDNRIGSIEAGKDADLVLWSDHPLAISAKADYTLIEGAVYFDRNKQAERERQVEQEKWRLYRLMQQAIKNGEKPAKPSMKSQVNYHCETLEP